eukprot:766900-Hanusia_phi.AAC.1
MPPWLKCSYDHAFYVQNVGKPVLHKRCVCCRVQGLQVLTCVASRSWPSHDNALLGAVREWNGNPNAPDRVERAARPAFGGQWDLCVEDSIGRVGHVRAAARKVEDAQHRTF